MGIYVWGAGCGAAELVDRVLAAFEEETRAALPAVPLCDAGGTLALCKG